jgi:hypothetical protein
MIKHLDPSIEAIEDNHRPRFSTARWWLIRRLLAALNLVVGRFASLREWALQEAVESSPDFDTFEAWVVEHYAARGRKVTVDVVPAIVLPVAMPTPTAVVNSTYLQ